MTLCELLEALAVRGSTIAAEYGRLRHRGPRIGANDPLQTALATFHDEALWLLTSARLCVFCPRTLSDGDTTLCEHHRVLNDALAPLPCHEPGGHGQPSEGFKT